MPHVRIDYTPNLGASAHIEGLCQSLLSTLVALKSDEGRAIFPAGGTRVLAYPAACAAVGPGDMARGFVYVNLRINPGRPPETLDEIGQAVQSTVTLHFQRHAPDLPCRVTVHIDEGKPVFEAKGEIGIVQ